LASVSAIITLSGVGHRPEFFTVSFPVVLSSASAAASFPGLEADANSMVRFAEARL